MDKNSKNGKAPQGVSTVIEEPKKNGTPATSQSSVNGNGKLENTEKGAEAAQMFGVEDTIRKVQTLNELIEKRNILLSHQQKVNALKFGDFGDKDFLTLNCGTGGYPISSTSLCKKIAVLIKTEIADHIKDVEGQILSM